MAKPSKWTKGAGKRVWRRLRIEPYNPNARDADNDGIVQEGTAWERPAGARIFRGSLEVGRGETAASARPGEYRIVDEDGNDVDYTRSYESAAEEATGILDQPSGGTSPLSDSGSGTLQERGLPSVRDIYQTATAPPPEQPEGPERRTEAPEFSLEAFAPEGRIYPLDRSGTRFTNDPERGLTEDDLDVTDIGGDVDIADIRDPKLRMDVTDALRDAFEEAWEKFDERHRSRWNSAAGKDLMRLNDLLGEDELTDEQLSETLDLLNNVVYALDNNLRLRPSRDTNFEGWDRNRPGEQRLLEIVEADGLILPTGNNDEVSLLLPAAPENINFSPEVTRRAKSLDDINALAEKRRLRNQSALGALMREKYGEEPGPWQDPRLIAQLTEAVERRDENEIADIVRDIYIHDELVTETGWRFRTEFGGDRPIMVTGNEDIGFSVIIRGEIFAYDEDTDEWRRVGRFSRRLRNIGRPDMNVANAYLAVGDAASVGQLQDPNSFPNRAKGQGFASLFNGHAFTWLKGMGFTGAEVEAAWDGPYTWPRQGYRATPDRSESISMRMRAEIDAYREGYGTGLIQDDEQANLLEQLVTEAEEARFTPEAPQNLEYMLALEDGTDEQQNRIRELFTDTDFFYRGTLSFEDFPDDPRTLAPRTTDVKPDEGEERDVPDDFDALAEEVAEDLAEEPIDDTTLQSLTEIDGIIEQRVWRNQREVGRFLRRTYGSGEAPWLNEGERDRILEDISWDGETVRDLAQEMFGHEEIVTYSGWTFQTELDDVNWDTSNPDSPALEVSGIVRVMDPDDPDNWIDAGTFYRTLKFTQTEEGLVPDHVYNNSLGLGTETDEDFDEEMRGQGFANLFNGHAFTWARALGFKEVRLSTAMDGPYAWPRSGFRSSPLDSEQMTLRIESMLDEYDNLGASGLIRNEQQAAALRVLTQRARRGQFGPDSPQHLEYMTALELGASPEEKEEIRYYFTDESLFPSGTFNLVDNFPEDPRDLIDTNGPDSLTRIVEEMSDREVLDDPDVAKSISEVMDIIRERQQRSNATVGEFLRQKYGDEAPWLDPDYPERLIQILSDGLEPEGEDTPAEWRPAALEAISQIFEHDEIVTPSGWVFRTEINPDVGGHWIDEETNDLNMRVTGYVYATNPETGETGRVGAFDRTLEWEFDDEDGTFAPSRAENVRLEFNSDYAEAFEGEDLSELVDAAKGQGFATLFNGHSFTWLKAAGFDSVDVDTAWDGPYVWPRAGFRGRSRQSKETARQVKQLIAAYRKKRNGERLTDLEQLHVDAIASDEQARVLEALVQRAEDADFDMDAPQNLEYMVALERGATPRQRAIIQRFFSQENIFRSGVKSLDDFPADARRDMPERDPVPGEAPKVPVGFTEEAADRPDLVEPTPPRRPFEPPAPPLEGKAEELAREADGDWGRFMELLDEDGYVVIDYETTGLDVENDPVQVGLIKVRNGQIVARRNIFMNPGSPLGEWSSENLRDADGNPITQEWLESQPSAAEVHQEVIDFIGGNIIMAHNVRFDREVLERTLANHGIDYQVAGHVDTLSLLKQTIPPDPEGETGPTRHTLVNLTNFFDVPLGDAAHTADADSEATHYVFRAAQDRIASSEGVRDIFDIEGQRERARAAAEAFVDRRRQYEADLEQYQRDLAEYQRAVVRGEEIDRPESPSESPDERWRDIAPEGVLYRGETEDRDTEYDELDDGVVFFTGNREYAELYGTVSRRDVTLPSNPLDVRDEDDRLAIRQVAEEIYNSDEFGMGAEMESPELRRSHFSRLRELRSALEREDSEQAAAQQVALVSQVVNLTNSPERPFRSGTGERLIMDRLGRDGFIQREDEGEYSVAVRPADAQTVTENIIDVPQRMSDSEEFDRLWERQERERENESGLPPTESLPPDFDIDSLDEGYLSSPFRRTVSGADVGATDQMDFHESYLTDQLEALDPGWTEVEVIDQYGRPRSVIRNQPQDDPDFPNNPYAQTIPAQIKQAMEHLIATRLVESGALDDLTTLVYPNRGTDANPGVFINERTGRLSLTRTNDYDIEVSRDDPNFRRLQLEAVVDLVVSGWAVGSWSQTSPALQANASRIFGIDSIYREGGNSPIPDETTRRIMETMYEETQRMFDSIGVPSVPVFRGMSLVDGQGMGNWWHDTADDDPDIAPNTGLARAIADDLLERVDMRSLMVDLRAEFYDPDKEVLEVDEVVEFAERLERLRNTGEFWDARKTRPFQTGHWIDGYVEDSLRTTTGSVDDVEVVLNPLNSFSLTRDVAREFMEEAPRGEGQLPDIAMIISMISPVERIFSTPGTGPGSSNEGEAIVLGGRVNAAVDYEVNDRFVAEAILDRIIRDLREMAARAEEATV